MIRVAAFTKYGREAASTRQRVLQYIPSLADAGIAVAHYPLLNDDYVRSLATGGGFSKARIARSYLRRLRQLRAGSSADLVWIYAELFPYLPAMFEKLAFRGGKPVIYDFDDAFFHPYDHHPNPAARKLLGGKLEPLIEGAVAVCCGNAYLQEYASARQANAIILPTVVDTERYRPVDRPSDGEPTIGWIGSPSTWAYVRPHLPLLERLCSERGARFLAVGAGAAATPDRFAGMIRRDWSEADEVRDVQAMDIGIMPLPAEPWARGKSGYKLVQYMACGLPVVASPVGVNSIIVEHGVHGFLADSPERWADALGKLIDDIGMGQRMGEAGRKRAVADYSLQSQAPRLVEVMLNSASNPSRKVAAANR